MRKLTIGSHTIKVSEDAQNQRFHIGMVRLAGIEPTTWLRRPRKLLRISL